MDLLAKVPTLSCRLGRVPYDRAFGTLTNGCAPYDCAFGALIPRWSFDKNRLHPGIQSNVDGERLGLEQF